MTNLCYIYGKQKRKIKENKNCNCLIINKLRMNDILWKLYFFSNGIHSIAQSFNELLTSILTRISGIRITDKVNKCSFCCKVFIVISFCTSFRYVLCSQLKQQKFSSLQLNHNHWTFIVYEKIDVFIEYILFYIFVFVHFLLIRLINIRNKPINEISFVANH